MQELDNKLTTNLSIIIHNFAWCDGGRVSMTIRKNEWVVQKQHVEMKYMKLLTGCDVNREGPYKTELIKPDKLLVVLLRVLIAV